MTIVHVYIDEDTGETLVDHGYILESDRPVILPQGVSPIEIGAYWSPDLGEYIIPDDKE